MRGLLHADLVYDLLEQDNDFSRELIHLVRSQLKGLDDEEIEGHKYNVDLVNVEVEAGLEELGEDVDVYVALA